MTSHSPRVPVRTATPADIDAVVSTLTSAFFHDPLWGPAFPDVGRRAEQAAAMWRLYVTSALRYPWLLVTPEVEAAAVWIPPGGSELTQEEEGGLADLLTRTTDEATAGAILAVYDQLYSVAPKEPCFYLTLLGTHADHRGKGLGMGLLAESLARIDELGAPAYLESSNPANLGRYRSMGFTPRDELTTASGHVVTTMWRPAR
ncbi:GNAT family N-acetyltransferase [Streptomyces sp. CB01881]|uniref:GNAT family N-acetyltransferase n=1 Tax=Streptomyces sp. CB01881 TaxID=2078691 RepID=UPI000CDBA9E6|nr:GNAT family N-acetyltransferase [Streptomyces sp. CB01881]AUY47759.1 GNAT family N-acetyltransferase [Streptomyces sp. CB01881]TYC76236.1 GNAT family N-acetyltransferase [Streptomyces sp. CB01881]